MTKDRLLNEWKTERRIFVLTANQKPKTKDFGPRPSRNNGGKAQQGNSHREQTAQRQRQINSTQHTAKSFSNNRHEGKTIPAGKSSKEETRPQVDRANSGIDGSPVDNATRATDVEPADGGTPPRKRSQEEKNSTQAQEHKPAKNVASHTSARDLNGHVVNNEGQKKSKRRYIRRTPIKNDGPFFRNGTLETSDGSASTKGNGDHNENGKGADVPNGQHKGETANETIDFVPLPQRNRRPRKFYYKNEPGSKIEFPPKRENGDS